MADRGFTVKDMLEKLGIGLNISPFMEGRQQLPSEELKTMKDCLAQNTRQKGYWQDQNLPNIDVNHTTINGSS